MQLLNPGPLEEYQRRFAAARESVAQLERTDRNYANLRLLIFASGILIAWLAWGADTLWAWLLMLPIAAFIFLAIAHDRIIRSLEDARRRTAFYENGIARLEDRWMGRGTPGNRFADPNHPYAVDLDLFGRGSLFELICTARTRAGEETLAAWLLNAAPPQEVTQRQKAVRDLAARLDLREQIALLGDDVRSSVDPAALSAWGAEPPNPFPQSTRIGALLISIVSGGSIIAWFSGYGLIPLLIMSAIGQAFAASNKKRVKATVAAVSKPARELELLGLMLARLEHENFDAPLLRDLTGNLALHGQPPSQRIARLQSLVDYLKSRENMLFAPFAFLLLWSEQFAYAIEAWRSENGAHVATWLRVAGEFEALSSLASHSYEHPADVFPEITLDTACVEGVAIAHPLLPDTQAVSNDVSLGQSPQALVVSGSNMSGKSTLMRTLGTNVVLALAGGPVRANSFRLSPITLGASIRTQDSLQGGVSRFYAEITRLRQIVELADTKPPVLFLLDEILHGTNSHDRLIGAEAVVRALLAKGALGLVSTHDLALAKMADDPALRITNVHFQDDVLNGKMSFDYRLRQGVVEKSNALELMRSVGLPV